MALMRFFPFPSMALPAWVGPGLLCLGLTLGEASWAAPVKPASDAEIVETLPLESAARRQQRQLRRDLSQSPRNPELALALARGHLDQARADGDARFAGLALGALSAWPPSVQAPADIRVMQATVAQFLHDFDGARSLLLQALKVQPAHPQALITLATVHRVQGRLADSDQACQRLMAAGLGLHGAACLAENQSLRGEADAARTQFMRLLAGPQAQGAAGQGVRQWLWTSLAELEERAARPGPAETAWRKALAEGDLAYVRVGWADFLLQQGRPREVLSLLDAVPLTDAVLLRLSVAATRAADPRAAAWRDEMAERFAASTDRPEAARTHAREQAMFALWVLKKPRQALELARVNLTLQRESVDFLVFHQAARAQNDPTLRRQALDELSRAMTQTGIRDERLSRP